MARLFTVTVLASCLYMSSAFQPTPMRNFPRRTSLYMVDPNQPPRADPNQPKKDPNQGGGAPGVRSLTYNKEAALAGDKSNAGNYRKLSEAMVAAEKEAKRNEEERKAREEKEKRAREARAKKIAKLNQVLQTPKQTLGTTEDYTWGDGVEQALIKLDKELIGLKPVKSRVRELASMLVVDKMRQSIGLDPFISDGLHMCFTGAPGTGKTTVAFRMGDIFKAMGYCRQGHVVLATRDTLVGQYVGHTGPKTKEVIKQAMGGILFIDEAYYLYNAGNDRDYGVESIEILLKVMEERSQDLIVIFAGYKDRMDQFFSYIPGMQSRVNLHIDFPDMDVQDLVDVGKLMFNTMEYTLDEDAEPALREYVSLRRNKLFFSNARSVRNAVDLTRMAAANRVYTHANAGDGIITLDDLTRIRKEDFDGLLELIRAAPDDAILA